MGLCILDTLSVQIPTLCSTTENQRHNRCIVALVELQQPGSNNAKLCEARTSATEKRYMGKGGKSRCVGEDPQILDRLHSLPEYSTTLCRHPTTTFQYSTTKKEQRTRISRDELYCGQQVKYEHASYFAVADNEEVCTLFHRVAEY